MALKTADWGGYSGHLADSDGSQWKAGLAT